MEKLKVATVLIVLLLCFSFTVGAAETKVKTTDEIVKDKIKNKDFVKYQQPHDKTKFDREVAGTLDLKVQSSKHKVPDGFEVPEDGIQTMVSYKANGKIFIMDTVHKVETIQVPWNEIESLPGFDGEYVRITHYNDFKIKDGEWIQYVYNAGGYAYLEDIPFSEIIVDGFTGTYTKEDSNLNFTNTINLGDTFDSDDVSYINVTITDQYASKTNPYNINTTNLEAWWVLDDNLTDVSANTNDGTGYGGIGYTDAKYNNGSDFDGVDDYILVAHDDSISFNNTTDRTFIWWVNGSSGQDSARMLNKNPNYYGFVTGGDDYLFTMYDGSSGASVTIPDVLDDNLHMITVVVDRTNQKMYGYLDADLKVSDEDISDIGDTSTTAPLYIGSDLTNNFTGQMDNIMIYRRALVLSEIEEIYYDSTSQLRVKTNSNATYSNYWNSSSDNPLTVPYGAGESITSLEFDDPASIIQNGITIYDPVNILFNSSAEVGHTENTTNIYEEVNADSYQIYIQHIPGKNYTSGTISFTSDANAILSSPYLVTGMESNNTNAVMSYNDATREWTVTTGAISAGETYNYVLFGVLEGTALADLTGTGFGSDNMHAQTATANATTIIGSEFRATYGDTVWGNQSNDLWEDIGPLLILSALVLVVGVVLVSIRRFRE